MTALQGWIVIGLLVLIMPGIVGLGAEIQDLPYLWRTTRRAPTRRDDSGGQGTHEILRWFGRCACL
jgi:hypothetical protein